ncbi:PhnD/SsuA/transferrin family substrate-binding protein [Verticiella sediminum]|uniref:PhnD/SsuA/transferrin family substrate-binding protein n=1 Tax=Verticiella sediminum TaxID=1247510 RepID=A0A556ANT8_9BURK|nr:PhnD/SsuA/transferrin family substrate-binding protein [Verticiella sediminum]
MRRRLLAASLAGGLACLAPAGYAAAADDAFARELAAKVPKGTRLVIAEQSSQASVPWKQSGVGAGVPYEAVFANFNGGPAVLEALVSGGVDIGYIGEAPLPIALAAGVEDLVAVALVANPGSPASTYLVVQPGKGIDSVADLKGRSVAYPPGTGRHMILAGILHEHGLRLGEDVKGVQLAGAEVAPTFASGAVDAAIVLGNQYFRLGEPPILDDGVGHNWGLNALVARKSVLDDPARGPAIADFVRRAVAIYNWQAAHPDQWIQANFVEQQGLTFDQGKRLHEESGLGTFYPVDDRVLEVFQEIADGLEQTGALTRKVDVKPYVDARFNEIIARQNAADGVTPRPLENPHAPAAGQSR